MSKKVVVIGGGIIGLSCAYYLHKKGHKVAVIDKSNMTAGASYVNAGYITPSHIIPLAAPGMVSKGLKWMLNSKSPFYIKPRLDKDLFKWGYGFWKSATKKHVERSIPIIKETNILSRELFAEIKASGDLGDFHLDRKGLLMLYKTDKEGEHEWEVAQKAKWQGLDVKEVTTEQLKKYEPNVELDVKGGIYYECDAHMTPQQFMERMKKYLAKEGITFYENTEITKLEVNSENKVATVESDKFSIPCQEVVIASGTWSSSLVEQLKVALPMQAGKGYSISITEPSNLQISMPAILMEAKVAVTPMINGPRFAGTMELSGINSRINRRRVDAVADAAESFYKGLVIKEEERKAALSGLRPLTPDGLPYIGRLPNYKNVVVATGHAMMGWSLGPITGQLVSNLINEEPLAMDISAFKVDRFH